MSRKLLKLGALEAKKTAFFLCDVQEKFRPQIKHFGEVVAVANKMLEAAKHLKIPVYVSEQHTKSFGHTTKDINLEGAALVYNKSTFSMYNTELKERLIKDLPNLGSAVVFGIAAHVCVEQTVIDLLHEDINVHVLADGVSSQSLMDRELALQRFQTMGCFVTTAENVLLKLLGGMSHPALKEVSEIIQNDPTPDEFGAANLKI
ncbi:isochorismatase domain-containing protein 1-like [Nymphalis io]|uniref:isochorismatase domain-containing protein 1-like n=1 Tax=Inachis io TaxID=171585 RepID=UPI002167447B|nr:isochorismatase domain-containing protein 1-like [Nymphalis io]